MSRRLVVLAATVLLASTVLVGSVQGGDTPTWSVRSVAKSVTTPAASTHSAQAAAAGDSRRNPDKVQIVVDWDSRVGRAAKVSYSWGGECWNQDGKLRSSREDVISMYTWGRTVTLADGETFREFVRTYDRDYCEVRVDANVGWSRNGTIMVKVRDLK